MFFKKFYKKSYSQLGEDLLIEFEIQRIGIKHPFYVDIGCNHPIRFSNTYLFYRKGGNGICIDPNISFKKLYGKYRANDIFIASGVTGGETCELPYYVMDWHEFNSFDRVQAEQIQSNYKGRNNIREVINLPVVNINDLLREHLKQPIDILSLDVEGLDLEILSSWDLSFAKPKIICAEHKNLSANRKVDKIYELLAANNYQLIAMNEINGIYIDKEYIDNEVYK